MGKDRDEIMEKSSNAYLTVCVALCTAVILSLFLVLIDGVRRNGGRLEAECVTEIGLYSVMAEYHRELMKQFNLFAIDASYGTVTCSKTNTEAHLQKYVEKNLDYGDVIFSEYLYRDFLGLEAGPVEVTKVSILTDHGGAVFRKCAAEAIGADVGLEVFEQLQGWIRTIEVNGLEEGNAEEEKRKLDEEIEKYDGMEVEIQENQWDTLRITNPTSALEEKKRLGLLKLVVEDEEALSRNALDMTGLIWDRSEKGGLSQGNIPQREESAAEQLAERFFFQEYLLKYLGRYGKENAEDVLRYQIEYLIAGHESDVDNLRSVINRLCLMREAANAVYLLTDETKYNQIKAVAEFVCTLILLPELSSLLEGAIVLGWAFAESVYDVKTLLSGGRVPLLKDGDSWHYGLESALQGELDDVGKGDRGLSYEDYLRVLMMLGDKETLTMRAMNMVEADIRNTSGNFAFRLDGCYVELEAKLLFYGPGGCSYEIIRRKKYR